VAGFMNAVAQRGIATERRSAGVLAWAIGFVIFVEANIGVFVAGPVARPIFDRLRISREKLAYILDSTASPKATVLPINSWGAYILGLLAVGAVDNPLRVMLLAIPLNVYAWGAILMALCVAVTDYNVGPMVEAERRVREEGKLLRDGAEPLVASDVLMLGSKEGVAERAINLIVPIVTIVVTVLAALWVTGGGNPMEGDGAASAFYAVGTALVVAALMYRAQGIMTLGEITSTFMKGVGGLIPIVVLLMLAYVIGDTCRAIGTGEYLARAAEANLTPGVIPAVLFVLSGAAAFSTGTSWGTWALMMPIALPMVAIMGLHAPLTVAAVLGGGIFGDHCSPISDSTIISSMSAGTDHIDHVRTQLPYALIVGGIAVVVYLALGFVL
jgi:Na+/H+ antiporter NhaC